MCLYWLKNLQWGESCLNAKFLDQFVVEWKRFSLPFWFMEVFPQNVLFEVLKRLSLAMQMAILKLVLRYSVIPQRNSHSFSSGHINISFLLLRCAVDSLSLPPGNSKDQREQTVKLPEQSGHGEIMDHSSLNCTQWMTNFSNADVLRQSVCNHKIYHCLIFILHENVLGWVLQSEKGLQRPFLWILISCFFYSLSIIWMIFIISQHVLVISHSPN